jgi:hypothetical protein
MTPLYQSLGGQTRVVIDNLLADQQPWLSKLTDLLTDCHKASAIPTPITKGLSLFIPCRRVFTSRFGFNFEPDINVVFAVGHGVKFRC